MNIFATDLSPVVSSQNLDDKRLVKMVLETAQLLSTALRRVTGEPLPKLYRSTHENHPCTVWARSSFKNYAWLLHHGISLCDEYTHRFRRVHTSRQVIEYAREMYGWASFPEQDQTEFANCTGIIGDGPVYLLYRRYMIETKWDDKSRWTNRNKPEWYI